MRNPSGWKLTKIQSCVIFFISAGLVLRISDLGANSLWLDESISSIAALAFLEKGIPVLPSGLFYGRGLLNTFLIASSFAIFGINEFAARLPSVLFGVLTILIVYFIASRFGNKRIGIIAALLITFSVWEIAWSRQARMYQQLQFFYILSLYLFYEFTRTKSLKMLVLLVFSALGTVISHEFGYALIPVFLIYLTVLALKERSKNTFRRTIPAAVIIFGALLGFAYFMGVIPFILGNEINYYDTYIYLLKKDLGIFLFLAVPGGTVLVKRDWKKGLLLISGLIIPLYFIFFHVLLVGTRYLYFVIPILFILVGFFLDFVIDYLQAGHIHRLVSRKAEAEVIVAVSLILAMYFSGIFTFNPEEKYDLGVNAPWSDFKKAYTYVKEDMQPGDAIVSAWTPPSMFYLGKSDYWLAFDVVGMGMDGFMVSNTSQEIYTNATAIKNVETLVDVREKYERGWIVVDNLAWYKLHPEIRGYIEKNIEQKMSDRSIRVYMWNGPAVQ